MDISFDDLPKIYSLDELELLNTCPLFYRIIPPNNIFWFRGYKLINHNIAFYIPKNRGKDLLPKWASYDTREKPIKGCEVFELLSNEEKSIMVFHMDIFKW